MRAQPNKIEMTAHKFTAILQIDDLGPIIESICCHFYIVNLFAQGNYGEIDCASSCMS